MKKRRRPCPSTAKEMFPLTQRPDRIHATLMAMVRRQERSLSNQRQFYIDLQFIHI